MVGDIKAALISHIKNEEIGFPEEAEEPKKVSACLNACSISCGIIDKHPMSLHGVACCVQN